MRRAEDGRRWLKEAHLPGSENGFASLERRGVVVKGRVEGVCFKRWRGCHGRPLHRWTSMRLIGSAGLIVHSYVWVLMDSGIDAVRS